MLRLDDQVLISSHLMDTEERAMQSWFRTEFPILADTYDSGLYLEPNHLDMEVSYSLPVRYHTAHCVRALRRYVKAKLQGKHISPRDLDLHHLDHCVGQLESFVYQPVEEWQARMKEEVQLIWHTDVCF